MPAGPPSRAASFSGAGGERTAGDVHATLCALVTTEAAKHSAWAEYAAVLLDEETAAFFAARLTDSQKGATDGESSPPSKKNKMKKRKLGADTGHAIESATAEVPQEVSLRVACLDGTTLDVTVPQRELVREVKRTVGQVRCNVSRIECLASKHCMQRRSRD